MSVRGRRYRACASKKSNVSSIDAVLQQYVGVVKHSWLQNDESSPPREQIVTLFRAVQGMLGSNGFFGCLAVRAMAEFGGTGLAVESSCQAFKHWERATLEDLARRAGAADPANTALRLLIVYEGMFAYTQVMRASPPAEVVDWVEEILAAATSKGA